MATVAATTMGNGAPVRIGLPRKSGVCRCLFGRPTAAEQAEISADARSLNEFYVKEKSRQYDFDFLNDRPVSGDRRWVWELVGRQTNDVTPANVAATVVDNSSSTEQGPPQSPSTDDATEDRCTVIDEPLPVPSVADSTDDSPAEPIADDQLVPSVSRCRKRSGGKTIKDFFQVKKPRSGSPPFTLKDIATATSTSSSHSVDQVN